MTDFYNEKAGESSPKAASKLLDSVVELTDCRELEELEVNLIEHITSLLTVSEVGLHLLLDGNSRQQAGHLSGPVRVLHRAHTIIGRVGASGLHIEKNRNAELPVELEPVIDQRIGVATYLEEGKCYRLTLPVWVHGRLIALVDVKGEGNLPRLRWRLEPLVKVFGNYFSLVHENETDQLTGLLNRKTFERKIHRLIEIQVNEVKAHYAAMPLPRDRRHRISRFSAWMAIIDIDHFKRVNDSYGHVYGDEVLLLVAQHMRKIFRCADLLFRFGGEEFVVVLEPVDVDGAITVLNRFRETMAQVSFPKIDQITVSIGFTELGQGVHPSLAMDWADQALYYAKSHGRNQVCQFEQLVAEGKLPPPDLTASDFVLF